MKRTVKKHLCLFVVGTTLLFPSEIMAQNKVVVSIGADLVSSN
ncbi:hypothetical protein [uncultured Bacteroides sp.]|nr:hypothetical protein [uncultured Bacteroides sp.]